MNFVFLNIEISLFINKKSYGFNGLYNIVFVILYDMILLYFRVERLFGFM